jgi:hypothetical protein
MSGLRLRHAWAGLLVCALALSAHADAPHKKKRAKHYKPAAVQTAGAAAPAAVGDQADDAAPGPAAAGAPAAPAEEKRAPSLSEEHTPKLELRVEPPNGVKLGDVIRVQVTADALLGDDVTIAEQSFAPFEVNKKEARVEPPSGDRQHFVFGLELLALEAGDKPLPAINLRVVAKDNSIGTVQTESRPYKVQSLLANEPNAQPKLESKPVAVLEDNFLPIYILAGLAAAAIIAVLTLLASRYLQKRRAAAVPPPPPRPPWEIAAEALAQLSRQKQAMLDAGQGAVFVDQLSDVVRTYLGGRYAFDGLETTTDEMLTQLKTRGASLGFTQAVGQFLGRCDLVKFAKVEPDGDEVDLLFAKAQDLVQLSEPDRINQTAPNDPAHTGALEPTPPRRTHRPDDDGDSVV